MAGRPKIFNEEEAIEKAANIFWEKGYEASSSQELLKAMGIGKGSFYLFFKEGKKELYDKSLQFFANRLLSKLRKEIAESQNSIEYLRDFFMELADSNIINKSRGCFLGNALVEMATKDEYTKQTIETMLLELEKIFINTLEKAKNENLLKSTVSSKILGFHLLNLWNGINVTRRMKSEDESLRELIELNLELIK